MKNKYFYPIYKLKIKSWIKYWLIKQTEFKGVLSDILEGTSFYLTDCLNMKFKIFDIIGRSVQDGDPTPENPVPIKNTGDNGSINEKVQNKNFAKFYDVDVTFSGVKYKSQDDGRLLCNGTKYGGAYVNFNKNPMYLKTGNYVCNSNLLSGSIQKDGADVSITIYVNKVGGSNYERNAGGLGRNSQKTFSISEDGLYYIQLAVWTDYTVFDNAVVTIQIEQGTIATEYQAHEEQNISLTLPEGMKLCKIGEVADYFYKENGKWYKHEVIKKIVLTGNENWIYYANVGKPYFFYTSDYINIIKNKIVDNSIILCNYFQNRGKAYKPSGQGIFVNADSSGKIENGNLSVTTYDWGNNVETFKQFLREKKPEVYFAVKEPTEIEITDETLIAQLDAMQELRTYKPVTHISSEDEISAELKIQYWKEV